VNKLSSISQVSILIIGLIVLNFIGNKIYSRIDLTEDKRYTLSQPSIDIVEDIDSPIIIKVYLEGDFPSEFKRLQIETRQILEELRAKNNNLRFRFINPLDDAQKLIQQGMEPSQLSVQQNGKVSEIVIFPWATVQYGKKTKLVSLLKDTNAQSQEEQLQNAIQNLEYAFVDAIHKVTSTKNKKIAILKGNGELDDIYIADFLRTLGEYYHLAPYTLDSVNTNPQNTLKGLLSFDLAIIAKPTERFTEQEKYTLDQFIVNGGKTLWMIDQVHAELDSLMATGKSLAFSRDLNLTDLLFNYGVRINPNIVKDLYSSKIPLATGKLGNKTQYDQFLWQYFPVVQSKNNHPINKQIEPVNLKYANSIDTLKNSIDKTILLQSSPLSKTIGTPTIIDLKMIAQQANPNDYNNGNQILSVLLEGKFNSAYSNRVKPFQLSNPKEKSNPNKMIVIADGDVIANQVSRGQPERLGVDKWTGQQFGNKEFLLNCVNYLLDDTGLINVRSRAIDLKILNREKAYSERTYFQLLNTILPLLLLAFFGFIFNYLRKKKYS
jgi:ABC-2 type transport system permease protein